MRVRVGHLRKSWRAHKRYLCAVVPMDRPETGGRGRPHDPTLPDGTCATSGGLSVATWGPIIFAQYSAHARTGCQYPVHSLCIPSPTYKKNVHLNYNYSPHKPDVPCSYPRRTELHCPGLGARAMAMLHQDKLGRRAAKQPKEISMGRPSAHAESRLSHVPTLFICGMQKTRKPKGGVCND